MSTKPDWDFWSSVEYPTIFQIVALLSNIDPVGEIATATPSQPNEYRQGEVFRLRLTEALGCIGDRGFVAHEMVGANQSLWRVDPRKFLPWALERGWGLPPDFSLFGTAQKVLDAEAKRQARKSSGRKALWLQWMRKWARWSETNRKSFMDTSNHRKSLVADLKRIAALNPVSKSYNWPSDREVMNKISEERVALRNEPERGSVKKV